MLNDVMRFKHAAMAPASYAGNREKQFCPLLLIRKRWPLHAHAGRNRKMAIP
jgi:hypothetical protein